jgi:trehalose-6-phosphate synthase
VGWFLHTPFPSSEIYRTLPVREEVLRAVLKSDLIGFHTYDYARHFVSACTRILGLEVRARARFPPAWCCHVPGKALGIQSSCRVLCMVLAAMHASRHHAMLLHNISPP